MLRNGGNECNYTKFVDVMIGDAASCLHVMTQAARPCVLFINGEFWGILNLQEKWTDQSVEDRYGVARSNVVIIKNASVEEGTEEDISLYDELMSWADRDLSDDAAYREFCGIVDIDTMIDFCAVKCFFGDRDWFQYKNEALWRSRSIVPGDPWADGKWRWMLFDTDQTMGLFDKEEDQPEYNFIPYAMEVDPLFGSVMANESFRRAFLARLRYLCGVPDDGTEDASVENDPAFGVFSTEEMTERIERYAAEYRPFFSENLIRFGFMKEGIFEERVEYMKRFVALRPGYILSYAEAAVEGSFT